MKDAPGEMTRSEKTAHKWSPEHPFTRESIVRHAPVSSGVYEVLQSVEYPRYEGKTRVLKIGKSESDLQAELLNHLDRHTAANRLVRGRLRPGIEISFRYSILSPQDATDTEGVLLREFEDEHWDLPMLNSQRGYGRGEDRHYRGK